MNKTKENKNECNECNHAIDDNDYQYIHCPTCLKEFRKLKAVAGKTLERMRDNYSPKTYARLECAITPTGFEVSCVRHDQKIYEFDIREFMKGYFEYVANKEVH